ncbi:MAG: hypothetical protein QOE43_841 [Gaiellaceae bacterium]|nr:hypothetical protein [Gaiellaceae bacterium]
MFHPKTVEFEFDDFVGTREWSWREIARASGATAHGAMQFETIADASRWRRRSGTLSTSLVTSLIDVLRRHTTRPEHCYFAVWEGWGGLPERITCGPMFTIPGRGYHLLTGPIEAAAEDVYDRGFGEIQTASIWWPDDRAWCVATEIDLDATFIGCSRECLDDLLADPAIEAFEIAADMPWGADPLN